MIDIAASTAFMIYIGATLSALLGIWLSHHWKSRRKKIAISKTLLLSCEFCRFVYLDDSIKPVTKCPQCHSYNKGNSYTKSE